MNDRFKFRVWDDIDNKYIDRGVLLRCGELALPSMKNDYDMNPVDGRYFIEQCTGLKDKNGNLIYEGDIVKTHLKRKGVVKWNDIIWCYRTLDKASCTYIMEHYDIEIIGNIHENLELLEEKE